MDNLSLFLLPFIAALIGWSTNWVAIKMLFHPKKPIRFAGITIQGIFPKKQKSFAASLGAMVARELLHFDEIAAQLRDPQALNAVRPSIESHVDHFLHEKLKEKLPVISMFVGQGMLDKIKEGLMEEIDLLLPEIIGGYTDTLRAKIDIEQMVTLKVAGFSSDKLEEMLFSIMKKEFKFVEILGGVLGFIIGLVQLLLIML